MKKWVMVLLCGLLFSGCMTKTETQFKEYDVPQGEHKVIELMNVDMSQFTDEQATAQIRAWTETAAAMYDELIAKGMVMGAYNYIDIITSGDFGIPVNKKLAKKLEKIYDRKMNGSGIKGFMHKIFG